MTIALDFGSKAIKQNNEVDNVYRVNMQQYNTSESLQSLLSLETPKVQIA